MNMSTTRRMSKLDISYEALTPPSMGTDLHPSPPEDRNDPIPMLGNVVGHRLFADLCWLVGSDMICGSNFPLIDNGHNHWLA